MSINSINTNVAALRAQENIGAANRASSSSIARLSSGERIVRAADDVASLSAGTALRTNVTTLRTALINTSQGSSLLQVADGALAEITDILQRQKAIATQAGSGSLTSAERSFLNQEFQNLTQEIDRLATQTNFNGVNLLDGSLFEKTPLEQTTGASRAQATISIVNPTSLSAITINGVDFTPAGADLDAQVGGLLTALRSSTNAAISELQFAREGDSIVITSRGGGAAASDITITAGTAADWNIVGESVLNNTGAAADLYKLAPIDSTAGLEPKSTVAVGTRGDTIVQAYNQTFANTVISFIQSADPTTFATDSLDIEDGQGNVINLTEGTHWTASADYAATIDSLVGAINNYTGNGSYILDQVEARREGFNLIIEKRTTGNVVRTDQATALTAITFTGLAVNTDYTIANAQMDNSAHQGIGLEGITNDDFVGTVSGFNVDFKDTGSTVDVSLTVGGRTYAVSDFDVSTDGTMRMVSAEGGDYLDVDIQGATQNIDITNQEDANDLAARLDTAFEGFTFYQDRNISSYTAAGDIFANGTQTGSLNGTSVRLQASDFSDVAIQDVRVRAAPSANQSATIEIDINGVTYRSDSATISDQIGAGAIVTLTSEEDANSVLTFRGGTTAINLANADQAQAFEDALTGAFGIGAEGSGETLNFQVGVSTTDTLSIDIGSVTADKIYGGQTLDVLTTENAAAASNALDAAIDAVTAVRAEVGALQSRFDFASANIESSIQNQDAARGVLLDTDIAAESTAFASVQVQLQAGISVLAQANLLPQNLLKLIG